MSKPVLERRSFACAPEEWAAVVEAAKAQDRSASYIIRQLIIAGLKVKKVKK